MSNIRFFLWIFRRRLPWFLAVAVVVAGLVIAMAWRIPPVYSSNMRMIIETPQIPASMAELTVSTPPEEHLERLQQALLSKENLVAAAKKYNLPPDPAPDQTDDQTAGWMAKRTKIVTESGKDMATILTVSFEAPTPEAASGVLVEYMDLLQRVNTEFRTARAAETLDFFKQEADRLGAEVESQGSKILAFKNEHSGALPDDLEYRMRMRTSFQERQIQVERSLTALYEQRRRSTDIFERTGQVRDPTVRTTPEEQQLDALKAELATALVVLSPSNTRVRNLKGRIAELEKIVKAQGGGDSGSALDIELVGINSEIAATESERTDLEKQISALTDSIERTSVNAVQLQALSQDYDNAQRRYSAALERLSQANTGERIETLARGQAVMVTEAPETPTAPSRPNRKLLAAAGILLGLMAGGITVALLEYLNNTVRRPEDMHKRLGIWPIATLPHIPARRG